MPLDVIILLLLEIFFKFFCYFCDQLLTFLKNPNIIVLDHQILLDGRSNSPIFLDFLRIFDKSHDYFKSTSQSTPNKKKLNTRVRSPTRSNGSRILYFFVIICSLPVDHYVDCKVALDQTIDHVNWVNYQTNHPPPYAKLMFLGLASRLRHKT